MKEGKRGVVTVKDAAGFLRCSEAGIRKWIAQGVLQPVKLGRSVRLRQSDLDKIVERGQFPTRSSQLHSAS